MNNHKVLSKSSGISAMNYRSGHWDNKLCNKGNRYLVKKVQNGNTTEIHKVTKKYVYKQ